MIDLLLFIILLGILVLLYFQLRIKRQQERLIEFETEAVRKLQKNNSLFVASGHFGLQPDSSYLKSAENHPRLMKHRKKVLVRRKRKVVGV